LNSQLFRVLFKGVNRITKTAQSVLKNIYTIVQNLAVGPKLVVYHFLLPSMPGVMASGIMALSIGTASDVLVAKLMKAISVSKVIPQLKGLPCSAPAVFADDNL
jgi:oxaloacetate decarboxylase beta subunit